MLIAIPKALEKQTLITDQQVTIVTNRPPRRYLATTKINFMSCSTAWCSPERRSVIVPAMPAQAKPSDTLDNTENSKLADLLVEIASSNKPSFEAFYDATIKRTYSLALRITRKDDIAEEVISDLYMQVWRNAKKYQPELSSVIAWLAMMCRSRSFDALRQRKSHTNESTNIDHITEPAIDETPQDLLLATEQHTTLYQALSQLKAQERQLVALAYFRGYTHAEMAAFTGIPLGTVKTQIRRATIALKSIMIDINKPAGGSYEQ